jgi:hypothetical protein
METEQTELDCLKAQLRAMKKRQNRNTGRFNWGDYHLGTHIKELEKRIRQIQSNTYPKQS